MMTLYEYSLRLVELAGKKMTKGEIFAKVLAPNDDAGKHGVLIPIAAYSLFPEMHIADASINKTVMFESFDAIALKPVSLAYKYYQRYPERRITRVNPVVNNRDCGKRLQIVLRGESPNGEVFYVHDAASELGDRRFALLWNLVSAGSVPPDVGVSLNVPIQFAGIKHDAALALLLDKFDAIRGRWHDSRRTGDTGIGYTFESLLGIKENNDQTADFHGIELKCKQIKGGGTGASGKVNLFQLGPTWMPRLPMLQQLTRIGRPNGAGLLSCHSQVTTLPNNLQLRLVESKLDSRIELHKSSFMIGYWLHKALERRLREKHSRAAFVLASVSSTATTTRYCYKDLIYCEDPAIDRFLDLVEKNQLVFEFMMSEKSPRQVRNHGYPWRLVREELLDQLFSVRVKLR